MNFNIIALRRHKEKGGKISVISKFPLKNRDDLSVAYTPGVAAVSRLIAKDKNKAFDYTSKGNMVAVITDGSAVLGLGNIGPEAALPVMEGKVVLFKELAGVDAFPLCLNTQDSKEIIQIIKSVAPSFGGINLEDISAPRCFEIEDQLQDIGIPVFHDDQHGTAVVVLAGLINAAKVVGKSFENLSIVINGAGASGFSIANFLTCLGSKNNHCFSAKEIVVCDTQGIIHKNRSNLSFIKNKLTKSTNPKNKKGDLKNALIGADVFVGVSAANVLTIKMIKAMAEKPIIFALANPVPEIDPKKAKQAGAAIVATGRSDYPNQVNNALGFPGIFRGALDVRATKITYEMKYAAAEALVSLVKTPSASNILPNILNKQVVPAIARAVRRAYNAP